MTALTLPLKVDLKHVHLSDEQFYQLCINNPDLNVEMYRQGQAREVRTLPTQLSGESVLPRFVLRVERFID